MKHAVCRTSEEPCQECLVGFGAEKIREDFPILWTKVHGKPLVYLDNAATTQKPQAVLDTLMRYYTEENSNVHRGVHFLSQVATQAYESGRTRVRQFLNAAHDREIIFTRGTTEAINLLATAWGSIWWPRATAESICGRATRSSSQPWSITPTSCPGR